VAVVLVGAGMSQPPGDGARVNSTGRRNTRLDRAGRGALHALGRPTSEYQTHFDAERALHEELRGDRYGQNVRLEQERIGFAWVQRALRELQATG
jgi:hypothetical protein